MTRSCSPDARRARTFGLLATILLAAGMLTVLAPSAPAHVVKPLVQLGPTSVANGTAVVSGTVGLPASHAQLTINGQPVGLQLGGHFSATVALNGRSNLILVIANPATGETATTNIPLTTNIVGPGGLIGPGVLAALEQAGLTILKPVGGFRIFDGLPLYVGGSVLSKDNLSSLTVNGVDVLGSLTDGRFGVQLPGTTREVTVTMVDRQGVSQTTVIPVEHATTPPAAQATPAAPATPAAAARSVAASKAVGVRIARVRYQLKHFKRTKRLRVIVTVTDRRGLRVRGATASVRSVRARWIVRNSRAKRTDRFGRTSFLLIARNRAVGKRLRLVVHAKTPRAKTKKATAVRLPRIAKRPASRGR